MSARRLPARSWLAEEALSVARRERDLSPTTAVNRSFYACFYATSAVLLMDGQHFVKHAGVRAAIHRDLVKAGRLAPELAQRYDELFEDRTEADYLPIAAIGPEEGAAAVGKAEEFVQAMREILATQLP